MDDSEVELYWLVFDLFFVECAPVPFDFGENVHVFIEIF